MYANHRQETVAKQIYELRYTAYLGNDSINPNSEAAFSDRYDVAENCHSHIEYIDGMPAGSIRACIYDPARPDLTVSAMTNFQAEIEQHIGLDTIFVQANRFAIHPMFQNHSRWLKYRLLRFVFDQALDVDAKYLIGAPRPSQMGFYKQFLFEPISEVKNFNGVNFKTVLMACPLDSARKQVRENPKYHILRKIGFV